MDALLAVGLVAAINLAAPDDGAVYDTHTPCVNEFLSHPAERSVRPEEPPLSADEIKRRDEQNRRYEEWVASGSDKKRVKKWERRYNFYERNAWTEDLFKRSCEEAKTYRPFRWRLDFPAREMTIEFSETSDFKNPVVERLPDGCTGRFPWFLKLGTKYFWRVTAKDEAGARVVSDVRQFSTLDNYPRMIGSPAFNFRDLGGGTNTVGRRVRQGLVYRGQAPHGRSLLNAGVNTSADEFRWFYLDTLGIRTELDLRSRSEADEAEAKYNHVGLDRFGARHLYHPVYPYHISLPDMKPKYAEIFRVMTKKENYPIYFHCAVGSDRTGSIGVILDGLLGRSDEQIYDDYELPTMNRNLPRLRYCRKAAAMFADLDPALNGRLKGANISENVVNYLRSIGITTEEMNAIREIMLEPEK